MDLNPRRPRARRLRAHARLARRALAPELPSILVFTDPGRGPNPIDLAHHVPPGWGLVYRHFGAANRSEIAHELARLARIRRFCLLVGADGPLAKAVGAHGVHWPEALHREAQHWNSAFAINTMSAHTPRRVLGPQPRGIDARVLSTAFVSSSLTASAPMGAVRMRRTALSAQCPVYALGGITADTGGKVASFCGLAGVGQLAD